MVIALTGEIQPIYFFFSKRHVYHCTPQPICKKKNNIFQYDALLTAPNIKDFSIHLFRFNQTLFHYVPGIFMSKFRGNFRYFPRCFLSSDKLANRGKFLGISLKFPEEWRLFPKALNFKGLAKFLTTQRYNINFVTIGFHFLLPILYIKGRWGEGGFDLHSNNIVSLSA